MSLVLGVCGNFWRVEDVFEYSLAEALRDLFSSVFAESMKKQASLLVLYHKAKNKQTKQRITEGVKFGLFISQCDGGLKILNLEFSLMETFLCDEKRRVCVSQALTT